MPPSIRSSTPPAGDPVDFSIEDAMKNAWVEDADVYLRLDIADATPPEAPSLDPA